MITPGQAGMHSVAFVVPGSIDTRTGGSIYDRRMAFGLRDRGWRVRIIEVDQSFPFPTVDALRHAAEALASIDAETVVIVDGLALGAMPDLIERVASRLAVVALVHLPLACDVGFGAGAERFADGEARALACASLVITTGHRTVQMLKKYPLPSERVVVIEPGTDRKPLARGSNGAGLQLLCVATLNPIKAHEQLLRALARVVDRQWQLTCAGSLTRDPDTAARVRDAISDLRLGGRVSLAGELDEAQVDVLYETSDLFVLASRQETYGMAVAEALAHGIPVVSTATGAIPQLVGEDAGIVVPPDDIEAMSAALSRVLSDDTLRDRLTAGARQARERLRTWDDAVESLVEALEATVRHG